MSQVIGTKGVSIYVDGFNLYHRVLEQNPSWKWLCLRTLFSKFIFPNNPVLRIKYFTAKVDPYAVQETAKQRRQKAYWDALKSQEVEVIEGRLEERIRECKATCQGTYRQMTEKMSDVKLALNVVRDFDPLTRNITCVMTADLDIIPALQAIREIDRKCSIFVILPSLDDPLYFSRASDFSFVRLRQLNHEWLSKSQFQKQIEVDGTQPICRPDTWH